MSRVRIEIPKKYSISLTMANTAKRMTIPTNAFVILPLALSSACLSPPEEIHWIAPITSVKKNIKAPTMSPKVTREVINFWKKDIPD